MYCNLKTLGRDRMARRPLREPPKSDEPIPDDLRTVFGQNLPATARPPHQSTGTKIVWRGLSPDDLVMWPLRWCPRPGRSQNIGEYDILRLTAKAIQNRDGIEHPLDLVERGAEPSSP
jgi:hypothetical protein